MTAAWAEVEAGLDRAAEAGRSVRVWLRDDDCTAVTPGLDRLALLCRRAGLPVLLAVIPEPAEPDLTAWIAEHPEVTPCQHGFAHRNHAPAGERARELGGRPAESVLGELARGRAKLQELFGDRLSDILVPPWNRIDPGLVPRLPDLGFTGLSTFGPPEPGSLRRLNSDLDIMDWRNGRIGRPLDDLARKLAGLLAHSRQADSRLSDHVAPFPPSWPVRSPSLTVGILTHHLVHDATAWAVLEDMLGRLRSHPAVTFTDAGSLLASTPEAQPPTRPPLP